MKNLPIYPDSEPITLEHAEYLKPLLRTLDSGISEFTFANLFLFRHHYHYRVSAYTNPSGYTLPVISGTVPQAVQKDGERTFVMLPFGFPGMAFVDAILEKNCYIKNFPEREAEQHRIALEQHGFRVEQDRANFDYLYNRSDLATLNGRKYHKKRNLVNAFINNYNYEEKRIEPAVHRNDLLTVLEAWRSEREESGDYDAALEAIEMFDELDLRGCITYTDGRPSAYSMGEVIARGTMFAIHFEKAAGDYKGIYQFINRSFASMLADCIDIINREQDLGDPGLRQAKMSYRPSGFTKKYRITHSEFSPCPELTEETEEENFGNFSADDNAGE